MQVEPQQLNLPKVLCCMCGVPITPNSANTCATCLASTSDITKGISTEATLHQCRGCQRWHKEAGKWMACELESRELMALCLSHVSGLRRQNGNKKHNPNVRLIDASWIWTEPHSMRLKVRLTVQREVQSATILQQSFTVVFIVRNQQCIECQAEFRQGSWKALVQVRQRVRHKRTFLYLEQLILKHGAHRGCLSIETFRDGMDFYFPDRSKANRFISFLENVCPTRTKMSKKLIGTDDKSNISNYKYTNYVEICPLCKDDLLFLPDKLARNLGNLAQLCLVKSISNVIHLIDPLTGQTASLSPEVFWREPIVPLATAARSRLTRFIVLGKEAVVNVRTNLSKRTISRKQQSRIALVTFAREDDLGINDVQHMEQSHVGYLLKAGDVCVGYDLQDAQLVNDDAEKLRAAGKLPSAVLLRKLYGGAALSSGMDVMDETGTAVAESVKARKRIWKLQRLDVEEGAVNTSARGARNAAAADEVDEEDFLQEVEADREMRSQMNLYKNDVVMKTAVESEKEHENDDKDSDNGEDDQCVRLEELLDGLVLDSVPDDDHDEANAAVMESNGFELYEEGEKAAKDGIKYIVREDARHVRDKDVATVADGLGEQFDVNKK